jgi:hypothetical protein
VGNLKTISVSRELNQRNPWRAGRDGTLNPDNPCRPTHLRSAAGRSSTYTRELRYEFLPAALRPVCCTAPLCGASIGLRRQGSRSQFGGFISE